MACEQSEKEVVKWLRAYLDAFDELGPLLRPLVAAPPELAEAIIPGSPKFQRIADLQVKQDEARKRYRAAWDAWLEAKRIHRA